jgi:CubicO group peptidase (beta-lactamase class C family)
MMRFQSSYSIKNRTSWSLAIVAIVFCGPVLAFGSLWESDRQGPPEAVPLQTATKLEQITATLEREVPKLMNAADVPGLSIAIVRNGELAWQHGFGFKDSIAKTPVTDDTVFEAASLSKPVFAYAVMKLVDSGKFDLDKPLNEYLPGNYDVGPDPQLSLITARRVLSHTTGFPNWRGNDPQLKIYFTPGERFSYSGEGFVYMAKVIEHLTHEKFNDFMKKMVFGPLGMTSSSYVWEPGYENRKVSRHNSLGLPVDQNKPTEPNAAASLHTTVQDYARFVAAILNGTGLKEETRKQMLTPQIRVGMGGTNATGQPPEKLSPNVSWGLGVGLQTTADGLSFWHWGDNGECKAFVEAFDRQKIGMVMFANGSNGLSFISEIVSIAIGGQQPAVAWLNYESYKSPARLILKSIIAKGAQLALHEYCEARKNRGPSERLTEAQMNRLGYELLYSVKRVKDAVEVFKLNVEDFPESSNTYDSLGEAYVVDGNDELAIKNYQRSVELNPKNDNGIQALKKLLEKKK